MPRRPFLTLLTGGYVAFVGWLTLSPQDSVAPATHWGIRALDALHRRGHLESVSESDLEFLANVGLFVPVGLLLTLLLGARYWWVPVLAAVAMTSTIEWVQHYVPGRVPDQRDLIANSSGAVVGVTLALVLALLAPNRRPHEEHRAPRDEELAG